MWLIPVSIICGRRAAGPVAHAIAVRTEVGAALDRLAWNRELRLRRVEALLEASARRVDRHTAGGARLIGATRDVPVARPLPDVARYVVEPERVCGIRADRRPRRPDAHIAWAAAIDEPTDSAAPALREALFAWFGKPV
jgi:hypothetical protein